MSDIPVPRLIEAGAGGAALAGAGLLDLPVLFGVAAALLTIGFGITLRAAFSRGH